MSLILGHPISYTSKKGHVFSINIFKEQTGYRVTAVAKRKGDGKAQYSEVINEFIYFADANDETILSIIFAKCESID